jgi:hypothetical protein
MKRIFSFLDFLNEALRNDPHLEQRETERLMEANEIKLSPDVMSALKAAGIEFKQAERQMLDIIKSEVKSAIKSMLRVDFPPANSYILPVKKFEFEVDGQTYPVNIIAYSIGKSDVKKKHIGNQYWIPCYKNKFFSLFLIRSGMTDEEISEMSSDHIERIYGVKIKSIVAPSTDFVSTFVIENGKIGKKKESKGLAKTVDVTGQWNLAPGRELKFWMPARNEWVRGEIIKVDNDPAYKTDKFFKVEMMVMLGDKVAKMMKKISPGDKLMIPVKTDDGEVDVPVTVHDSLFITDKRASSPIMKII